MEEVGDTNEFKVDSLVSLKIPSYGAHNPRIWFAQVEALFLARGVKSQAVKYAHVVAALPIEIAAEVGDLIDEVPTEYAYDKLKAAIIQCTSASDEKRLQQLLTECELGDRKPSQLLRHMRQLAGNNQISDSFLRQIWMQWLPCNARQILSTSAQSTDLNSLAEMADKILEIYHSQTVIQSVRTDQPELETPNPNLQREIEDLQNQVKCLTRTVESLTLGLSNKRHFRKSRSRSRSANRKSNICWYHKRFGDKAQRCIIPCSESTKLHPQENFQARQ